MSTTETRESELLLWDVARAAAALGVSVRTLKEMQSDGRLPDGAVVRLGARRLFSAEVLRAWVAKGCPPPEKKARR